MNLCNEFLNYADACVRAAAASKEPQTKAAWTGLAERWSRVAETLAAERQAAALRRARQPRRQARAHRWSHAIAP